MAHCVDMTEKVIDLISQIVSPGKTWGCFFRKTLSTLLVASIGAYGFNAYQRLERSHWEDLPLHTAIAEGDIASEVQTYIDNLITQDPSLKSIWVYSWPDARSLITVANSGDPVNPLPLGYFLRSDSEPVGTLVFEECACLKRPNKKLLACPIMASNDAWGVVVFEHKAGIDRPDNYKNSYAALTHKLSNLIYHD